VGERVVPSSLLSSLLNGGARDGSDRLLLPPRPFEVGRPPPGCSARVLRMRPPKTRHRVSGPS